MTTTSQTAPTGSPERAGPGGGPAQRRRSTNLILIGATALGLVLRLYQLTRPGFLSGVTEYDDGVYFGSALRLVAGTLPYRDFVMVQPPGITWLMAPLALVARATSTSTGFASARVLTALAGAAGVPLAGLLVRHRGALATAVTCAILAAYPAGINAAHTVLLEPWLVLFCLLGALWIFDGDEVTGTPRRLAWGGAAFGLATAIKLWAALPAVVVLVLCRHRRASLVYVGGLMAAFAAAVAPVAAVAPRALVHDVLVAQLDRVDLARLPVWDRLASLTGLSAFSPVSRGVVLVTALGLAALVVGPEAIASVRERRGPPRLDAFALVTAGLVLAAFLWPPDYYLHYGWFFAPFLALSAGLSIARLAGGGPPQPGRRGRRPVAWCLGAIALSALAVMSGVQFQQETRLRGDTSPTAVRAEIPRGACVLTDIPALTITADRFVSDVPGCAAMVDPIGTDYALSGGENGLTNAGRVPALERVWMAAFKHAGYVWLACGDPADVRCKTNRRVPWTPTLVRYFRRHFKRLRGTTPGLYVRDRPED